MTQHKSVGLEQQSHRAIIQQRCPISGKLIPTGSGQYVVLNEVGKSVRRAFCFAAGVDVPEEVEIGGRQWTR